MESFLVDLKKDVQCSLCNDTLTEPKILPCFHIFCKPCVKRHAELVDEVNVFKCPRCKSQTPLPEPSSVEDLQPSPIHSRILKGLALIEGEKVCSVSDSHSSGSWYCFDCDHSLCQECRNYHSFFIKDHKVLRLAEFKKDDIEFIITRENPCTSHPQQRLELFCGDCDSIICRTCLIQDHKDHTTTSLNSFAEVKKVVLSKQLQVLQQLELDDKEKQQQEEIAITIKEQGEKARLEVKEKTKKMIQILQENERKLLKQIDDKLNAATQNLKIIHHIPAVKEYIKKLMKRGLASEMITIQETQCSEKFFFHSMPPSMPVINIPNLELVQQVNTGLGEIQMPHKTDNKKSTVAVEGEPEAARQQKLIIRTKTSAGLDSINTGDVVDVHIRPEDDVEIEEKDVRTDGRIEVAFRAKVAGPIIVEVKTNGYHVSNSPLRINIAPQRLINNGQFYMYGVNIGHDSLLTGIETNRDNSRIAVNFLPSSCVHIFNSYGNRLQTYGMCGGPGKLNQPEGLAFLSNTDLVIADSGNNRICIVNTTTGTLVNTFGFQGKGKGEFMYPCGVHVDDHGNIVVCDMNNDRVQVFTRHGDFQYQFGLQCQYYTFSPTDVITHDGRFYVSDRNNHVIHVFEKKGDIPSRISTIGGYGSADGQLWGPMGLTIDNNNHLLVCDRGNKRVQKFTLDGRVVGKTSNQYDDPVYITVLNSGQFLFTSFLDGRVVFTNNA